MIFQYLADADILYIKLSEVVSWNI